MTQLCLNVFEMEAGKCEAMLLEDDMKLFHRLILIFFVLCKTIVNGIFFPLASIFFFFYVRFNANRRCWFVFFFAFFLFGTLARVFSLAAFFVSLDLSVRFISYFYRSSFRIFVIFPCFWSFSLFLPHSCSLPPVPSLSFSPPPLRFTFPIPSPHLSLSLSPPLPSSSLSFLKPALNSLA